MHRTHQPRTHAGASIDTHTIGKHAGAQQQLPVRLIHILGERVDMHGSEWMDVGGAVTWAYVAVVASAPRGDAEEWGLLVGLWEGR